MNAPLTAVMAQEHVSDLTRAAARFNDPPSRPLWRSGPAVELRPARADDDQIVRDLAALDDARPLEGPVLLAVVGGQPVAAIALDDERVVDNPFLPTAHAVSLLQLRARHVSSHVSARRRRRFHLPRRRLAQPALGARGSPVGARGRVVAPAGRRQWAAWTSMSCTGW